MDKDFSIRMDFGDCPTFGKYLQDQPEAHPPDTQTFEADEETDTESAPQETAPPLPATQPPCAPASLKTTKKKTPQPKAPPVRDVQALVSEIKRRLIDGESDMVIAEDLSLGKAEYRRLKTKVYDQETDGFAGKSAEEKYVDYCFEQQKCLNELDKMIGHFSTTKQHNAMVGAVRAKSQIMETIHKTGVSMGVIKQEVSYDREIDGVRVCDLNNKEIRDTVATEIRGLQNYIDKFGDRHILEVAEPSPMADPTVVRVKR